MKTCSIKDCQNQVRAYTYCNKHYIRFKKYNDPMAVKRITKESERHGMYDTKIYSVWRSMINRCSNPNDKGYTNYGGRGITVCDAWKGSFLTFVVDMGLPADKMSIDRIDVNGNYCKENCRWANATVQSINTRKRADNTSGFKGVYQDIRNGKWWAFLNLRGKRFSLGYYTNLSDAVLARKEGEQKYYFPILQETTLPTRATATTRTTVTCP